MKLEPVNRFVRRFGVTRLALASVAFAAAVVCAWNALPPGSDDADPVLNGRGSGLAAASNRQNTSVREADFPGSGPNEAATEPPDPVPAVLADPQRLAQLETSLNSGPVDDQIEAIRVFARVGTPQQKALITERAADPGAQIAVRLAAIENLDWNTQLDLITQLMRSDPQLGEAILYIAEDKQLPPESASVLVQAAVAMFRESSDAAWQLAVLHFLSERDPQQFDAIAGQVSVAQFSPTEYEDFAQLLETRRQEQQFLHSREIN